MKKWVSCLAAMLLLFFFGNMSVFAAADTTAPEVRSVTINTTEVSKPGTVSVSLDIVEEEVGVASISMALYAYRGDQMVMVSATKEFENAGYTGAYSLDIPITDTNVAGEYYVGQIDIFDYAGNKRMYWNSWKKDGYDLENESGYVADFHNSDVKCYIVDNKTVTVISDGDDEAPFVTSVNVATTTVNKGQNIKLQLEVSDESAIQSVLVALYGYRGAQIIQIPAVASWKQNGDIIDVQIPVATNDMSGEYYIGQINVTDVAGNERMYWNGWKADGYDTDTAGAYVADFHNSDYKCYIKNNAIVNVPSNGDDIAPFIEKIELKNTTITKPGVIKINIHAVDDFSIEECRVCLYMFKGEQMEMLSGWVTDVSGGASEVLQISIPVSTDNVCGTYYIGQINIKDKAGNERMYWNGWKKNQYDTDSTKAYVPDFYDNSNKAYVVNNATITIKEEFDVAFEYGLSNKNLLAMVQQMGEGKTAKIRIDGNGIAPKELFQAIKTKDKTLVFYKNNYQWIFNGKNISTPKDISLLITFAMVDGSTYGTDKSLMQIDFPENGKLPGKSNVRIKSDYTYNIFNLKNEIYLYYLDKNNKKVSYEKDSKIEYVLDGTDHWCKFDIKHNSTYLVSGEQFAEDIKVKKIEISGVSKKIAYGKKIKLVADVYPYTAQNKAVNWKSSNKKYATVNAKGVVTLKRAGVGKTVTITATAKDGSKVKAKYKIKIMHGAVKKIKLTAKSTIKAGKTVKVKATVKATSSKANTKLKWTSSNEQYAKVNSKGVVKTKAAGKGKTVTITATSTDGTNKKAKIKIKLK